jgi:hypothetical protein
VDGLTKKSADPPHSARISAASALLAWPSSNVNAGQPSADAPALGCPAAQAQHVAGQQTFVAQRFHLAAEAAGGNRIVRIGTRTGAILGSQRVVHQHGDRCGHDQRLTAASLLR